MLTEVRTICLTVRQKSEQSAWVWENRHVCESESILQLEVGFFLLSFFLFFLGGVRKAACFNFCSVVVIHVVLWREDYIKCHLCNKTTEKSVGCQMHFMLVIMLFSNTVQHRMFSLLNTKTWLQHWFSDYEYMLSDMCGSGLINGSLVSCGYLCVDWYVYRILLWGEAPPQHES